MITFPAVGVRSGRTLAVLRSSWMASTSAMCEAPQTSLAPALQGPRAFSSGSSSSDAKQSQCPPSGWPVMPGPLHGWAAQALVGSEHHGPAIREVSVPTGTSPCFLQPTLELEPSLVEKLEGPLDLDAVLPSCTEDLQIPQARWEEEPVIIEMPGSGQDAEGLECHQTYNPGNLKRKRRHGFLSRITSKGGRKVISRRKQKGRRVITA